VRGALGEPIRTSFAGGQKSPRGGFPRGEFQEKGGEQFKKKVKRARNSWGVRMKLEGKGREPCIKSGISFA